ncbi:YbgC/FadM family acyl-CoA thioesterase [Sutterella seckii]|uniref:YbgC/FadM family acyl-CoA thioesterase n=1 Tax=Sutterella seckii TaxID=1944635 RepID=A0A6I1ESG7_9BURK|nr:YbgC/FadM family acyl-CoA thioesterase [Sutterella seckii]KAB7660327.1 YbgC/FadM family acyl-CoA thioesterase [Sutterella seckii]
MSQFTARFPVHIYWEDTDAGGIVYHSNYLKYMERARSDLMRRLAVSQAGELTNPDGQLFVAASVSIRYRRAARLDDDLTVVTRVKQLRRASIVFEQNVVNAKGELVTEGEVRVGCVNRSTLAPSAMKDELYERICRLLDEAEAPAN